MTEDRLARFEAVGERLWPYVRYFCLCGACLDAQEAVAELAALLGKSEQTAALEAADKTVADTARAVIEWANASSHRRRMRPECWGEFIRALEARFVHGKLEDGNG